MSREVFSPFGLPFELCEIIFLNLDAVDLLNCTLVSRVWKAAIEDSKCFDRIVLKINKHVDVNEISASNRKFRVLRLERVNQKTLETCLETFSESVRKIEISNCFIDGLSENQLELPNLLELTVSSVSSEILQPLLCFHKNLKILNFLRVQTRGDEVQRFFELNENVTELNLYLDDFSNIFHQDISKITRFHLKSLTISYKSNFEIDANTLANVCAFLVSQGKTLQTIDLINAATLPMLHQAWNFLSVVERLHFFSADPFYEFFGRQDLKPKPSLLSLEFHVLGPINLEITDLRPILAASPNLSRLGVWYLTTEILDYTAYHLPKLQSVFCATMERECDSHYVELKSASKSGVNENIRLHQYL